MICQPCSLENLLAGGSDYRLIEYDDGTCAIHEVYYDRKNRPTTFTIKPIELRFPSSAAQSRVNRILEAFNKPPIRRAELP